MWWHMPVISTVGRWKKDQKLHSELEAKLEYISSYILKVYPINIEQSCINIQDGICKFPVLFQ